MTLAFEYEASGRKGGSGAEPFSPVEVAPGEAADASFQEQETRRKGKSDLVSGEPSAAFPLHLVSRSSRFLLSFLFFPPLPA